MDLLCTDVQELIYSRCSLSANMVCKMSHYICKSSFALACTSFRLWRALAGLNHSAKRRCKSDNFDMKHKLLIIPKNNLNKIMRTSVPCMFFKTPVFFLVRVRRHHSPCTDSQWRLASARTLTCGLSNILVMKEENCAPVAGSKSDLYHKLLPLHPWQTHLSDNIDYPSHIINAFHWYRKGLPCSPIYISFSH